MNPNESITSENHPNLTRLSDHTLLDPDTPRIDLYAAAKQRMMRINAVSVALLETAHKDNDALNGKDLYHLGCLFYDLSQEGHAILDEIEARNDKR